MKALKKLCCTLLASLLCLSFVTPVLAASTPGFQAFTKTNLGAYEKFTDIDQSKWYGSSKQGVIKTACELNILNGMSPTKFDPEGTLRLNEAVKIACVIHALYTGQADPLQPGTGKHWADPYLAYAEANGILQKDEFTNYDRPATRSEMAHIFAKSLPEDGLEKINTIFSIEDVDRYDTFPVQYAADIFKLYRAGVLAGEPKTHAFRPTSTITRAETAAIVARLTLPATRENFDIVWLYGAYYDQPDFSLTNETGKTLSTGQHPYQELADFIEGLPLLESREFEDEGQQHDDVTGIINSYEGLSVKYFIDPENPRSVFIASISTKSPAYVDQRGIRVGCSEAELVEKYPDKGDSVLQYFPPQFGTYSDATSYSFSMWPSTDNNMTSIDYSTSQVHDGTVYEISLYSCWR